MFFQLCCFSFQNDETIQSSIYRKFNSIRNKNFSNAFVLSFLGNGRIAFWMAFHLDDLNSHVILLYQICSKSYQFICICNFQRICFKTRV